jgi:hypothetical protein
MWTLLSAWAVKINPKIGANKATIAAIGLRDIGASLSTTMGYGTQCIRSASSLSARSTIAGAKSDGDEQK